MQRAPRPPFVDFSQRRRLLAPYNVLSTRDAREQLGGNPYGNLDRIYRGSADDPLQVTSTTGLRSVVERFLPVIENGPASAE